MTVPPSQPPPEEPHAGSEDDPRRELDTHDESAVIPPRRYDPAPPGQDPKSLERSRPPQLMDRVVSASIPLSTLAFFLIGFGTGRWYLAWIVFLIPPVLRAWNRD